MLAPFLTLAVLAQAPELDPDAAASWLLQPCGKVVVAPDGDPELAKAVRVALVASGVPGVMQGIGWPVTHTDGLAEHASFPAGCATMRYE